jgi:hypothetical protein
MQIDKALNKINGVKMKYWELKQCFECAHNIQDFFFHLGYKQIKLPRLFRKLIARSELHRAWLIGITGSWLYTVIEREQTQKGKNNDYH